MTAAYRGWKLVATARVLSNGHFASTIGVFGPRPQRPSPPASPLPFEEEFSSAEEALAKAVEYARKHIDAEAKASLRLAG